MENRLPKLDLNITNRCNLRCAHCAFDSGMIEMSELTLGELEKLLRETKELGGKRFDITGGEPLVRKDVEEIISLGKSLGYKIELVTNGTLLTRAKLQKFKELGLDSVAISLDGSTSEVYNRIRRKDEETFRRVVENIEETKRNGLYTKINTTVFASNLDDILNVTELALKIGVDEHGLYYFTPVGRGSRSTESSVEPLVWLDFLRTKLSKYAGSDIRISLEYPFVEKDKWDSLLGCIANVEKSHLQVLPDGNVYPCAILASYNKSIANLHEKSIKEIWKDDKLWEKYWEDVSQLFQEFGGSCVNFQGAFNLGDYSRSGYCFVCPLRKFELGE
jgi:radical SAM protein with 4Fe4S-binding SPASM domain